MLVKPEKDKDHTGFSNLFTFLQDQLVHTLKSYKLQYSQILKQRLYNIRICTLICTQHPVLLKGNGPAWWLCLCVCVRDFGFSQYRYTPCGVMENSSVL